MKSKNWNLVETSGYHTISKVCKTVMYTKEMVGITGKPGAGKTTALKVFCANNKDAIYIRAKKSMRPKRFFEQLLKVMGVNYSGTIYDMIERIATEWNEKSASLIVIDEAGKIDQTMMMYLHDLRDETEETTGIVLTGVEYFKTNLKKAVDKQKQGMPEFYSRISRWYILGEPTRPEIEAICKGNGLIDSTIIKKIQQFKNFRQVANQIRNELLLMEAKKAMLKEPVENVETV
jgi:DNA transposition AAA+ family ATPase